MPGKRPTVRDLLDLKGKRQLTEIYVRDVNEAAAAEAAGVELLSVEEHYMTPELRAACPSCFIAAGVTYGAYANASEYIRAAFKMLRMGADACYSASSVETIRRMYEEGIPVVSHVGLIPSRRTWTGGFRAVGKTAAEAMQVFEATKRLEEAGAFAIELEVVPHRIAAEIARRTSMFVISMGAGTGGDAQYLFSEDILGDHGGHYPRHSKTYRDFHTEHQRLQGERIAAFSEFVGDVRNGVYPEPKHLVEVDDGEYEKFMTALDKVA